MVVMVSSVTLDDWELGERDKPVSADPGSVEAVIREIEPRWSADLFLLADADDVGNASRWLGVTASSGRYTVLAQLGEGGPWMHLVGDAAADGEMEFAHGGQPAPWPRRFCVTVEDAVAVARHYAVTTELLDPSRWSADDGASGVRAP
jgi:hypothetical protein